LAGFFTPDDLSAKLIVDLFLVLDIALTGLAQETHLAFEIFAAFAHGEVHFQIDPFGQGDFSILCFG
jgi:hypothetical protein